MDTTQEMKQKHKKINIFVLQLLHTAYSYTRQIFYEVITIYT